MSPEIMEKEGSSSGDSKCSLDIEPFAASQQTPVTSEPIILSVVATLEKITASSGNSNCSLDIEPFAATSQTVRQKELNELSNVVKLENVMENNANVTEEHITFKRRSLVPFSFDDIERCFGVGVGAMGGVELRWCVWQV